MADTYTQLYFHIVFAVQKHARMIDKSWKDDLYKYITGIISNKSQKLMIINGMPDHVHILISTKPDCNLSDLVRDIKSNSTKWINENRLIKSKFAWQNGFGAFTVSQSQLKKVIRYIENQKQHHRSKSFKEEYVDFLKAYQIDYNEQFIFE